MSGIMNWSPPRRLSNEDERCMNRRMCEEHTNFDKGVICVIPEEAIGEEGNYRIDWRHI
jgi:hypothetical protein